MDPDSSRRRPRARPPAAPGEAPAASPAAGAGRARNPFAAVVWGALVLVAAVIAGAFATGTADDLPWGAIIGVVAVLAFAYVAGRRRARMTRGDEGDGA